MEQLSGWTRRSCTWSRRRTTGTWAVCRSSPTRRHRTGAHPRRRPPTRSTCTAWRPTPAVGWSRCRSGSIIRTGSRIRTFDREFHERFIAVPAPGTDRQLEQVVSRIAAAAARSVTAAVGGVPHRRRRRGTQVRPVLQDAPLRDRRGLRHAAGPGDDAADPGTGQPPDAGDAVAPGTGPVPSRDADPRPGRDRPTPGEARSACSAAPSARPSTGCAAAAAGRASGNGSRRCSTSCARRRRGRVQPAHRPAPPLRLRFDVAGRGADDQDGLRLHGERRRAGDCAPACCGRGCRSGTCCRPSRSWRWCRSRCAPRSTAVARQPGVGHGRGVAHRRARPGGADRQDRRVDDAIRRSCRPPCRSTPSWRC